MSFLKLFPLLCGICLCICQSCATAVQTQIPVLILQCSGKEQVVTPIVQTSNLALPHYCKLFTADLVLDAWLDEEFFLLPSGTATGKATGLSPSVKLGKIPTLVQK